MSDLTALDSLLSKLPSGWSSPTIASAARLINGRGFKPHEWETDGLPIIRIQNLNGSTDFNYYSGSYNPKIEVNKGDLLFAWSGSRGTSFGPHFWNGPKGVLNYHTWRIKVDESAIAPDFFYHALRFLTRIIEDRAHGASALVHVQKWEMEKFGFPCPNDRAEQQAIAAALSDADGVVAGLERVIAKKRLIKQGAMQDLLTARRRLPGFSGKWREARLGQYGKTYGGLVGKSKQDFGVGTDCYIEFLDVINSTVITGGEFPKFRLSAGERQNRVQRNDLLFNGSSETPEEVGLCAAVIADLENTYLNSFCFVYRLFGSDQIDPVFMAALIRSGEGRERIKHLAQGATRYNLSKRALLDLEFKLPNYDEQQAIAAIFSDMDAEIQTLEFRLAKARAVKEGMMQNLLTGRIRLV